MNYVKHQLAVGPFPHQPILVAVYLPGASPSKEVCDGLRNRKNVVLTFGCEIETKERRKSKLVISTKHKSTILSSSFYLK